jgi:hypothetical protein
MRVFLKTFAILLILLPINCWAASEIKLTRSQLAVLAHNLETAPRRQQSEFAQIALTQLYITYQTELNRSFDEKSGELRDRRKLRRWRSATNSYLNDIERALSLINQGGDYDFFVNNQDRIVFSVAGQMLMITGPNYKAESLLESNIVNQFCVLYDCQGYLSTSKEKFVRYIRPAVHGYWSMSRAHKADFSTDAGITFRFHNMANRKAKEKWSLELTRDLLSIIQTLKNIESEGYSVNFESFSIANDSAGDDIVKITINKKGDFINMALPTLYRSAGLLLELMPWLERLWFDTVSQNVAIVVLSEQYYAKG